MAFQTGSKLGVDFSSSSATALFTLMDQAVGTQDSAWVYVLANGAISNGDIVSITSSGTATRATPALVVGTKNNEIGCAQCAAADLEYLWVARRGLGLTVAVSATVSGSATLYLATTSGKLSDVAGSATMVGIQVATVSTTATTTTTTGSLSWPRNVSPGN